MLANNIGKKAVLVALLVLIPFGMIVVTSPDVSGSGGPTLSKNLLSREVTILEKVPRKVRGENNVKGAGHQFGMIRIKPQKDVMDSVYLFDNTLEVYSGGIKISMDSLKLPCEAKIHQYPNKTNPYLYRIDVVKVSKTASAKWSIHPKDR